MRKIILFVGCLAVSVIACAQSPHYDWAKSGGGTSFDEGKHCSTDASGNTIVTGFYSSTITFGTTTLTDAGGSTSDIYIVKYDTLGNVLWAKSEGGTGDDWAEGCCTDASGNIIVTGLFWSTTITFGSTTLTSAGDKEMFIVKYDPNGNVLWARGAGGTGDDRGISCSTDVNGNIFLTGYFNSPVFTIGSATLTNANSGNVDMYVVKYDASGNMLWAKSAGGSSDDAGLSCSIDVAGNFVVAGYFYSPTITFDTTTLTSAGLSDMFIVKYDPSGNVLWAKSEGGTGNDWGESCCTDANGNIIVSGYSSSPSVVFGTTTLTTDGSNDMYIAKFDASGNALWAKSSGGTGSDYGSGCSVDANGNIVVAGYFASPSITFGSTTLNGLGNYDMFIVKYDASGNVLWVTHVGGTYAQMGLCCSTDANGNIFVTGYFAGPTITFGATTLTNTNASSYDMFIAKLDDRAITGVSQITDLNARATVFPNPTSGLCFLSLPPCKGEGTVEVYSSLGEKVYSFSIPSGGKSQVAGIAQWPVDLSGVKDGIYFLRLKTENGIVTKKIIKQ